MKFASSLSDLARFKSTVKSACKEYVQSGDSAEFCRIVNSLGMSVYHQDLPHILIKYRSDIRTRARTRIDSDLTGYQSSQQTWLIILLILPLCSLCVLFPSAST